MTAPALLRSRPVGRTGVSVSVTSVLVPDVSVTVSGGKWGPSGGISDADALVIAQRVLGI